VKHLMPQVRKVAQDGTWDVDELSVMKDSCDARRRRRAWNTRRCPADRDVEHPLAAGGKCGATPLSLCHKLATLRGVTSDFRPTCDSAATICQGYLVHYRARRRSYIPAAGARQ